MEHWQVLKLLMLAEFWSEITRDKFVRMKNGLEFKKEDILPQ
jgi:hypothetical protein